jgi:hypothetical protein
LATDLLTCGPAESAAGTALDNHAAVHSEANRATNFRRFLMGFLE